VRVLRGVRQTLLPEPVVGAGPLAAVVVPAVVVAAVEPPVAEGAGAALMDIDAGAAAATTATATAVARAAALAVARGAHSRVSGRAWTEAALGRSPPTEPCGSTQQRLWPTLLRFRVPTVRRFYGPRAACLPPIVLRGMLLQLNRECGLVSCCLSVISLFFKHH